LVVDVDGAVVAGLEAFEVVLDEVLGGAVVGGDAGVAGAAGDFWSGVLGAPSFFSPALGAGASLPDEGFILSE
jgi:hypothetical protein